MMKSKIVTLLTLISLLLCFSCQAKNKESAPKEKPTLQYLTKAQFLSQVANYEKNPREWVYLGKRPCIIDFYADWCGPCRALSPILAEIAQEYKGKIDIYKVDVDKESELAAVFNVRSIPTLLFCPMQGSPAISAGFIGKEGLRKAIKDLFKL